MWQNKITGTANVAPDQLLANPQNWRIHPQAQRDALAQAIETIGYIQPVIVNQNTGHVIDGHLRISLALSQDQPEIPVSYVDLTPEEELIALASIDPLAGMAVQDDDILGSLLDAIDLEEGALADLLEGLTVIGAGEGLDFTQPTGKKKVTTCPECGHKWSVDS